MARSPARMGLSLWRALVLGVCLLSTGVALVVYVLGDYESLLSVLAVTLICASVACAVVVRTLTPLARAAVGSRVRAGLLAAFVATAAYDVIRWVFFAPLLHLDPYAAVPVFGRAIAGPEVELQTAYLVGFAYHVVNGLGFGTSFAVVRPRGGVMAGVAWGAGLELAMLAIYPGWLRIDALQEFTAMSLTGHLAYGATLGLLVPRLLTRRSRRRRAEAHASLVGASTASPAERRGAQ